METQHEAYLDLHIHRFLLRHISNTLVFPHIKSIITYRKLHDKTITMISSDIK